MVVDPADGDLLYAGLSTMRADPGSGVASSGLYASLDGGDSWERVGLEDRQVYVIEAAQHLTGTLIYVGINYDDTGIFDGGLYRGLSGGSDWELLGFSDSNINDLAVDPYDPSHLLLAIGHWYPTPQPMGLYESRDAGDTWDKLVFEPSNDLAAFAVRFDPFDPRIIYVSSNFHLYRSRDEGATWAQIEATSNRDFHTLYIPYGEQVRLFAGTSEGVYYRPVGARATLDPSSSSTLVFTDTLGFEAHILDDGGAVTLPTILGYVDLGLEETSAHPRMHAAHAFQMYAYQGSNRLESFTFQQPVTVTLTYTDTAGRDESRLRLLSWSGTAWVEAACGSYQRDPAANQLVAPVCQVGQFGLFFDPYKIFLPLTIH
jgi:hypothetical protein